MNPAAFDYDLDPAAIAQQPLATRDASRLLVLERRTGAVRHSAVLTLAEWLRPDDLIVLNDAAVVPARLHGRRASGGAIEVLLTEPMDEGGGWQCLARKARRLRIGERLAFGTDLEGVWGGLVDPPFGTITLASDGPLATVLQRLAELPLPPYIHRPGGPSSEDQDRYQTVFARVPGAVAAPTAGLHFTTELLETLTTRGVQRATVTLLVGAGTFLPLRDAHRVPSERYVVPEATADAIAATRARGGRVVAIGTTTVRALETTASGNGEVRAGSGRTDLVIGPGHAFRVVDALFTNFHLPRSSLLALVAAFAGIEPTLAAYREAAARGYRFYSYGDAMLIQ